MSSGDFGFLVNLETFMPLFSNRQVSEEPTRPVAPLINMFLGCNLSEWIFDEAELTQLLISQELVQDYNDFWHISDSNVMIYS